MWKPFKLCSRCYRQTWNIRSSLIEIFAMFILLSSVKILGVSFQILSFTPTFNVAGKQLDYYLVRHDPNIEYFSSGHLPFALLAMAISFIFVLLPLLLLAIYPCGCFHKCCLNRCGLTCQTLHVFMDAFQGSYRTEPRDHEVLLSALPAATNHLVAKRTSSTKSLHIWSHLVDAGRSCYTIQALQSGLPQCHGQHIPNPNGPLFHFFFNEHHWHDNTTTEANWTILPEHGYNNLVPVFSLTGSVVAVTITN